MISAGVDSAAGKCSRAAPAMAMRFVAMAHRNRARQTGMSSGRRLRHASRSLPASSNAPVRMARLARPSQTRSSVVRAAPPRRERHEWS